MKSKLDNNAQSSINPDVFAYRSEAARLRRHEVRKLAERMTAWFNAAKSPAPSCAN